MSVLPTQVVVSSESDPGTTYLVQLPYCPCKDFRYRRAGLLARLAAGDVTALAELFCKHLRKGLTLVGGWHSTPEVHADLTDTPLKALLRSTTIGFSARESNSLVRRADNAAGLPVPFSATLTGSLVDGTLAYDQLAGRYTLTVTR